MTERIRADELRELTPWDDIWIAIERAAFTIDEMDKDMAIMEINREALRRALHDEESR